MENTQLLYDFLMAHSMEMTEKWLDSRESDGSTYDVNASAKTVADITEQNQELIKIVSSSMIGSTDYTNWATTVGEARAKSQTELSDVLKSFRKFRRIFMNYLLKFAQQSNSSIEELGEWISSINHTFDIIIELTSYQYQKIHQDYMQSHREMVLELSSPVIPIYSGIGILPLVGSIDTYRAKVIREKTLEQASKLNLQSLIIDLSGVPIVDTMVANELFQVFKALSLLGINAALTGISPAIAQTSVQLGLDFSNIPSYANLNQALEEIRK